MAKLTRYLQKIFANNSNKVGVFGTGVDKETSKNVETLQSADYDNGWSAAIVTNKNYPIWQERDGVDYGLSYQIKYLDQMGVAEWIATEIYYTTSYCQYNGGIYRSKVDDNTGNTPIANTSNEYWQFLGRDFLNTQQVTNCLLEVPQHINYTLANGEFTLKAGSVVIVPYGTTDLSSTYTVGSTFINENLKVYDREFVDGKFIVWAQLQNDVSRNPGAGSSTITPRMLALYFDSSTFSLTSSVNNASVTADADAPNSCLFYNTATNLVKLKSSGSVSAYNFALPLGIINNDATYLWAYIKQTFNEIGYIGTAFWVDKGVKTLTPNGLNNDGSLNNIEHIQPNFSIYNYSNISDGNKILRYVPTVERISWETALSTYYDASTNYNRLTSDDSISTPSAFIGQFTANSNVITNFIVNPVLNINSMCDGQWTRSELVLANGVTIPTSANIEYDLSNYLPNDGCNYDVFITGVAYTAAASGSYLNLMVNSDIVFSRGYICGAITRASSYALACGNGIIPVGASRKINITAYWEFTGTFRLYACAYRRIGRNA